MRKKTERNETLVRFHKKHPDISYSALGLIFGGLSKQRVEQIIHSTSVQTSQNRILGILKSLCDGLFRRRS